MLHLFLIALYYDSCWIITERKYGTLNRFGEKQNYYSQRSAPLYEPLISVDNFNLMLQGKFGQNVYALPES